LAWSLRLLASLGLILTLVGCHARREERVLFPEAVRVRALAAPTGDSVIVDGAGRVTATQYDPRVPHPKVLDGGDLTADEVRRLRKAVRFTPPSSDQSFPGCCSPRHTFLFYGANGRYLGHFTVCFECGCTELEGERPQGPDESWIDWDPKAIGKIAVAHHLTPLDHYGRLAQ
jgi:hypothetical protein